MGADDIPNDPGTEAFAVVLTNCQAGAAGEEPVKPGFVLDEALAFGLASQGPGHLPGYPQRGKACRPGLGSGARQKVNHEIGVETAFLQVRFAFSHHTQGTGGQGLVGGYATCAQGS